MEDYNVMKNDYDKALEQYDLTIEQLDSMTMSNLISFTAYILMMMDDCFNMCVSRDLIINLKKKRRKVSFNTTVDVWIIEQYC